jgi:hypothetical protein
MKLRQTPEGVRRVNRSDRGADGSRHRMTADAASMSTEMIARFKNATATVR